MAKHAGKLNSLHLDRVWKNIPAQLAKTQNSGVNKFKFKGIIPGINRYNRLINVIDWLESAGLIIKVKIVNSAQLPLLAYTKENTFKLFVSDIGLLGALSELPPKTILDYAYGTYKGFFAENFVAQELLTAGTKNLYCWQEGRSEIEFLQERAGNIIPIEVKSGIITRAKSLQIFAAKYQPQHSIILSGQNLFIDTATKVYRYPLYLASKCLTTDA